MVRFGPARAVLTCCALLVAALLVPTARAAGTSDVYAKQYFTSRYGDSLRADVYFPARSDGSRAPGKFPVILQYDFNTALAPDGNDAAGQEALSGASLMYVQHGYVFVVVSQPGTGGSSGPQGIYDERVVTSGVDAVEWAGTQPWSTGAVGMSGLSGPGIAQPLVAQYRPKHLKTIVPVVTTTDFYRDVFCRGGVPTSVEREVLISIVLASYNGSNGLTLPRTQADIDSFVNLWTQKVLHGWVPPSPEWFPRPSASDPAAVTRDWKDMLSGCGAFMQNSVNRSADLSRLAIPVWSFGSFNDFFLQGNLSLFTDTPRSLPRRLTLDNDGHANPDHGYDFAAQTLRWYDRWLKGIHNGVDTEAPVDYWSIEQNTWHHASSWPLPTARTTRLYLTGGAPADPLATGALTRARPRQSGVSDSYVYDPLAGRHAGLYGVGARLDGESDNAEIRNRPNGPGDQRLDAPGSLVYLQDPLAADSEVTGPVTATLYAASTSSDTDWVVKLVDVFPDGETADPTAGPQPGYWGLATTGWLSGTRRAGDHKHPVAIPFGSVLQYTVDLRATSYVFKKGHRIGVMIASADAARTFANVNPATNTIYRSTTYPSHIDLPVVSTVSPGTPSPSRSTP